MSWTDEYREIVEFYWWEPQMMGRSLNNYRKFKSADDMWASLSRKEVPLNHVLNIFFALFPLEKLGLGLSPDARSLSSRENADLYRQQNGATQPDIFIIDTDQHVGIELKTSSKSSRQQIEKYIMFSQSLDTSKPLRMILITPNTEEKSVFRDDVSGIGCSLELLSFEQFCRLLRLAKINASSVELKLIEGVLQYMNEHFPAWCGHEY